MDNGPVKPVLGSPKNAMELLDMYFLDMRSALLETATTFDRIERAHGGESAFRDSRLDKLRKACELIAGDSGNRAEKFQILFSEL